MIDTEVDTSFDIIAGQVCTRVCCASPSLENMFLPCGIKKVICHSTNLQLHKRKTMDVHVCTIVNMETLLPQNNEMKCKLLIDLYYMTTIQSCFQCFCRVPQVTSNSITFSNLQLPLVFRVLSDTTDIWKEWMASCVNHHYSAGVFQITCRGGVGDSSTSNIVVGPFTTK